MEKELGNSLAAEEAENSIVLGGHIPSYKSGDGLLGEKSGQDYLVATR